MTGVSRSSLAYIAVTMLSAALDAGYGTDVIVHSGLSGSVMDAMEPTSLDTFTIRAAGALRSSGSIALVTRTTPYTLVSNTSRTVATEVPLGSPDPSAAGPSREVPPAVRYLLDTLTQTPAYVVDAKYDVLAWNRLATHFVGDLSAVSDDDRNMIRWIFRQPATDVHWSDPDTLGFTRSSVADLRAAYARYPGDPGIASLVTELLGTSPRFADMWAAHEVEVRRRIVKRVVHPDAGPLEFECQVLHVSDTDQRLVLYCAPPGSPTAAAFADLGLRSHPVPSGG